MLSHSSLLFMFTGIISALLIGCSRGGNPSQNPSAREGLPITEEQAFDLGLKGQPNFSSGVFQGPVSLSFKHGDKTATHHAGQVEIEFSRNGDHQTVTYSFYDDTQASTTQANQFVMTVTQNSLIKDGKKVGQIGSLAMIIRDGLWTYKFLKGVAQDSNNTPVLKFTARHESGNQIAEYSGVLQSK